MNKSLDSYSYLEKYLSTHKYEDALDPRKNAIDANLFKRLYQVLLTN